MSDLEPRDHPRDDELGAALRRRAGRVSTSGRASTAAAHDAVVRRAGAIRRRRVAVGGGGAMAVLLLGGILLLPRGVDEQNPVVTGDVLPTVDEPSSTVATTAPTVDPIDDAAPVTVDLSVPPISPATTDPVASSAPSTTAPTTSTGPSTTAAPTSVAGGPAPTGSSPTSDTVASSSSTPASSAPTTSAPDAAPAPFTNTYQSTGGSITVHWNGSALSLEAVQPASGFVPDVEDNSASRVRVRFEGADDDSRIEVRVADGQVLVDID